MKTQLHQVTGKNRFCGPTAIATVLGITSDEASWAIRTVSGKRQTTGMHTEHMVDTLRKLGCTVTLHGVTGKPTAIAWVKANRELFAKQHVILVHGNHFGTLLGQHYLCSMTPSKQAVPVTDLPRGRGRVEAYIALGSLPEAVVVPARAAPDKVQLAASADRKGFKAKALDIAKHHYIRCDEDNPHSIWVCPPDTLYSYELLGNDEEDPYFDDHVAGDWDEAHGRVLEYVELIRAKTGRPLNLQSS